MTQSIVAVNRLLCADATAFVRQAEADYARQLSDIADYIAAHRDTCPIVLISGPSGSGKTTTARMLEAELDRRGLETHTLSQDNYFRTNTPEETALRQAGMLDLESPARVDEVLLAQQLEDIIACKPVDLPVFDFRACVCKPSGVTFTRQPGEIVILEGIHVLNPAVVPLPESQTVRLYVSVRTRVENGEGGLLHPKYVRLLRRMLRDVGGRGRPAEGTLDMFRSVEVGEQKYIMPYKHRSTFDIDTFCPYELNVYRAVLPDEVAALNSHPDMTDLMQALTEALPLEPTVVPSTALIREFIGGSVYED
ncbi:MAG: nucleoside kinase [Clostridia bacterium]|nr:nucleoside kinase [Clostridia bacterium]